MEFRLRLKESRLDKNLTQKEIADTLNTYETNVSEWERGIKKPNIDSLRELCKVLDVSADYLLGLED